MYQDDEKNAHLKKLDNASTNLQLFKADLLDYGALSSAISGCQGIFHVASPAPARDVSDPEKEILDPAVKGTLNVLKASKEAGARRVVHVSSILAISMHPNWPQDRVMDETCWSDKDFCLKDEHWYCLSKTLAESSALKYAQKIGLDLISVCPTLVIGPMLQPVVNGSNRVFIQFLKGTLIYARYPLTLRECCSWHGNPGHWKRHLLMLLSNFRKLVFLEGLSYLYTLSVCDSYYACTFF
ncbi:cinnamoyl-CoA reductase 1 isoform X2 [Amborella trichopoda]|uniref:cinnamoyl-CoA reductase 1 isoform X2 n=1 Tax=Amborella trichopoda TaxID=13333 RepID=UPI0009BFE682|nr:cinnamoyl-CoA reductase 1 isoform X2 [Amborella trichopoda]|eukprot:XP_020526418.1 cinnamoyl-CoA reductase 1 isoform X2 [Amborella trichopoda]